jgi:peptide/nickel transport system substrate-binding protein
MFGHTKKWRLAAVGALLVALPLAACTSKSSSASGTGTSGGSSSAADQGTPVKGGTYTYDMEIAPQCSDPQVSPQFATQQFSRPVLDSLVSSSDGKTFKPWLATTWTISPDAKTYTFHLRSGVTFSDGTTLDAAAVKYNFDRIYAPATKSQYAKTLLGPYADTKVIDANTVEVDFSSPFNAFLASAATANLGIQSPTYLATAAPCSYPVGSGAYVIKSFNAQQGLTMTARPDYKWDPGTAKNTGAAYISTITMNFVPSDTTRVGSLTSGQVQNAEAPPASDVASLKKQGFQIINQPQPGGVYDLYISQTIPLWQNEKARLALRDALDVPGMINALYDGVYKPAYSPIAETTPGYDSALTGSWKQDIAQANTYLDQLGYTGHNSAGFRTNASGQELDAQLVGADPREQREDLSLLIKQAAAKVGINVTIKTDATTSATTLTNGAFGLTASAHVEGTPDILRLLFDSQDLPLSGGLNYGHVNDPQLDQWLDQATDTLDTATQNKLYGEVQQYVTDHALAIPLYQEETLNAATTKLKGITYDSVGYVLYYDAWLAP